MIFNLPHTAPAMHVLGGDNLAGGCSSDVRLCRRKRLGVLPLLRTPNAETPRLVRRPAGMGPPQNVPAEAPCFDKSPGSGVALPQYHTA